MSCGGAACRGICVRRCKHPSVAAAAACRQPLTAPRRGLAPGEPTKAPTLNQHGGRRSASRHVDLSRSALAGAVRGGRPAPSRGRTGSGARHWSAHGELPAPYFGRAAGSVSSCCLNHAGDTCIAMFLLLRLQGRLLQAAPAPGPRVYFAAVQQGRLAVTVDTTPGLLASADACFRAIK